MDGAPGILAITGEPTRNERVENLIKLTLSLQMRGGRPAPWRSAFVPFGVFNTVRNLVVLTGSVADAWPHPDAPTLLCDVSVVTEARAAPGASSSSAATPGTPQSQQQQQQPQQQSPGGSGGSEGEGGDGTVLVPVTPCSRCAAREVRKLSTLPVADRAAGTSGGSGGSGSTEADAAVPLTQRLDSVMARSMVVYHNEPEIVFGKCGPASFTLKFRIVCYSTHHSRLPYRVVVSLYDSATHTLVAQQKSLPITILDNHKSRPSSAAASAAAAAAAAALESPTPVPVPVPVPVAGLKRPPPSPPPAPTAAAAAAAAAAATTTATTATVQPTVTRVVPASGSVAGGTPVVVLGTGLGSSGACGALTFGGVAPADTHAHTDGALVCTLPPARHAGPVAVAVGTALAPAPFTYVDDLDERLWALARAIVLDSDTTPTTSTSSNNSNDAALDTARAVLGGRLCGHGGEAEGEEDSVEAVLVRVLEPLLAGVAAAAGGAGAWTRTEAETRRTLLHYAAARGYCRLGTLLLDAVPALRDAPDALGCTALHHAAMRRRGDFALLLLLRKASVRAKDAFGMTPEAYEQHSSTDSTLLAVPLPPPAPLPALLDDSSSTGSSTAGSAAGTSFLRYDGGTGLLEDNDPLLLFSHGSDEHDDGWVIIPPAKVLAAADEGDGTPADWARAHLPHIFVAGTVGVLGTLAVCVAAASRARLPEAPTAATTAAVTAGGQQQQHHGDVVHGVVLAAVAFGGLVAAVLAAVAHWARRVRVPLAGTGIAAVLLAVHQVAVLASHRLSSSSSTMSQ